MIPVLYVNAKLTMNQLESDFPVPICEKQKVQIQQMSQCVQTISEWAER